MIYSDDKQRNPWLDYLKAFAIYLVIVGHTINNCMQAGTETRINGIIYFVHIPLFLVISGFLSKDKKTGKRFWNGILMRFVIPYTVWTIILTTFFLGKTHLLNDGFAINAREYLSNWCHSFLWFIKAYLVVYILWHALHRVSYVWRGILGAVLLVGANLLFADNSALSEMASLSLYSYILFAAGACIRKYVDRINNYGIAVLLSVFIICLPFATHENNYFECSFIHMMLHGNWHVFLIRMVAGTCISITLIRIGHFLNTPPRAMLQRIGQQTLQIYMLQSLVVEAMLNRFVQLENDLTGMLLALSIGAVATFFCSLVVHHTSKIRIMNTLLWGTNNGK